MARARRWRGPRHRHPGTAARQAGLAGRLGPEPSLPGAGRPSPGALVLHHAPPLAGPQPRSRTLPQTGTMTTRTALPADWAAARAAALTPAQHASPLARRPYDLRHAAVSLWLNSGVPATEVARRAGHSVAVLLKIYAHCIDGQADAANKRIADALGGTGDSQDDQEP